MWKGGAGNKKYHLTSGEEESTWNCERRLILRNCFGCSFINRPPVSQLHSLLNRLVCHRKEKYWQFWLWSTWIMIAQLIWTPCSNLSLWSYRSVVHWWVDWRLSFSLIMHHLATGSLNVPTIRKKRAENKIPFAFFVMNAFQPGGFYFWQTFLIWNEETFV